MDPSLPASYLRIPYDPTPTQEVLTFRPLYDFRRGKPPRPPHETQETKGVEHDPHSKSLQPRPSPWYPPPRGTPVAGNGCGQSCVYTPMEGKGVGHPTDLRPRGSVGSYCGVLLLVLSPGPQGSGTVRFPGSTRLSKEPRGPPDRVEELGGRDSQLLTK